MWGNEQKGMVEEYDVVVKVKEQLKLGQEQPSAVGTVRKPAETPKVSSCGG